MGLFSKKEAGHAGSGLDKPEPKSLLEKVTGALTPKPKPAPNGEDVVTPVVAASGSD